MKSAESMTRSFPLADLLQETEFTIERDPVLSAVRGYNENFYISRSFIHNIVIKQDIARDESEGKFPDLLASSEQEFKQLCQQNPKKWVHWLEKQFEGTHLAVVTRELTGIT